MELIERKTIRLKGYDYSSPGIYFITVCVKDRKELLSKIVGTGLPDGPITNDTNILTSYGKIAENHIINMSNYYEHISVDKYVIMPNHIHFLLRVNERKNGPSGTPVPTNSEISKFVGTFKRFCNKEYGYNIWQNRSFDHVVRNEDDYRNIWQYIDTNVIRWQYDRLNGKNVGAGLPDGP